MKTVYKLKKYAHPKLKWVVRAKLDGKWVRKFFSQKQEAETYATQKNTEVLNQGVEAASFPTELRMTAQREDARVKAYGKSLTDAVDFYLSHLDAIRRSVSLKQAMEELVKNRKDNKCSKQYSQDLHWRLNRLVKAFPSITVAEITTKDLDNWLTGLGLSAVTQNTFRRDLRTYFAFCVNRNYCEFDPALKTTFAVETPGRPGILTVKEASRLLQSAAEETLPYWALGAFAGVRSSEIHRLEWRCIDFDSEHIEIEAKNSKTRSRRLIPIQPNLMQWLHPYAQKTGKVCPLGLRKRLDADRRCGGFGDIGTETDEEKAKGIELKPWPVNGLRHSFGSYYLAHFKNANALALEMGNSTEIIDKHYRELVKPKEAALYWQIVPKEG